MKIKFDENGDSFFEIAKAPNGNVAITICAKDARNIKKTIVNSVEITRQELDDMVKDLDSSSSPKTPTT